MSTAGPAPAPDVDAVLDGLSASRRAFAGLVPMATARELPPPSTGELRVVVTDADGRRCAVWCMGPARHRAAMQQVSPAEGRRQARLWLYGRAPAEVFVCAG